MAPSLRTLPRWLVALALLASRTADAQTHPPPAPVDTCATEHQEIAALEQSRRACDVQRSSCDAQRASCEVQRRDAVAREARVGADLGTARRDLDETQNSLAASQTARELVCSAAGGLVSSVLQQRSELPSLDACVSPVNRRALGELVASWRTGRATLLRLEGFARGETDTLPAPAGSSHGEIESLAQRLAGGSREAPLVYRRLLVEAVRNVAPSFWARLRGAGAAAVDAWFASPADLDPAFVDEAQGTLSAHADAPTSGPSQAAALRYVRTYEDVVGCAQEHDAPRQCARASHLQSFLESSTALIARQRVLDVWNASCDGIDADVLLAWLREFTTPQPALGRADWAEVTAAGYDKLVTCYLADRDAREAPFPDWLARRMPAPSQLTNRALEHLDELRHRWDPAGPEAACLGAARALRTLATPTECALPSATRGTLRAWFDRRRALDRASEPLSLRACTAYVDALWRGDEARVLDAFPGEPSADEVVQLEHGGAPTAVQSLRGLCAHRVGSLASFPANLRALASLAEASGEEPSAAPWRTDAHATRPLEAFEFDHAQLFSAWARDVLTGTDACAALGLPRARCAPCAPGLEANHYECALVTDLESRWRRWLRLVVAAALGTLVAAVGLRWAVALRRALRAFGAWRRETVAQLRGLGLAVEPDPMRAVFPGRMSVIQLALPAGSWERWGRTMAVVHAEGSARITERDVRAAALAARARDGELAIVTHDEGASPDLAAVRAMLDWAARGPQGAVQILPVSSGRLRWASSPDDLLDLVEQVSLRGNPFEVRGRLVSSSQFFNRERLVSGLLAGAQAGAWTVVTGLRRFGKSSLALEVARRLQAPHAYVDLAGFHHEITSGGDPTRAVDAILRYVCRQLHASAQALYGRETPLPEPPGESRAMDSDTLSSWVRAFLVACRASKQGRAVAPLVIFDEVEQAIGVGAERITNAIEVLSILVGRLRASLTDTLTSQGGDRVGVLFCSAIHAVLWAPLTTLGRQSLLGAFPSVSVPRLPQDAAFAMMRGLGARQGIRFTEPALALIVAEAQGIPILVRRIGSSVLELYDPERARQGSLGAVEIGIEGATAAVRREEEDGAPLRVWVESEIGDLRSPVGGLLRLLARRGQVPVAELKQRAFEATLAQFEELGLAAVLGPDEGKRRAHEAAGFLVRMLDEIGILVPEGDATQPHAFTFPNSIVRRILAAEGNASLLGF